MDAILDSVQTDNRNLQFAGFWIRFVAALIDGVILGIVQMFITFSFFSTMFMNKNPSALNYGSFFVFYVIIISMHWLYSAIMESSAKQGTVGKIALGLKVTDLNGDRISFGNATGRYFSKLLSSMILCIGYLMIAFNDKCQGLHDKIANTYVVRK